MDIREEAQFLLSLFGRSLNLDDLIFDEDDMCLVQLEDDLFFIFEIDERSSNLLLQIPLGKMPSDLQRRSVLQDKMLRENFYWNGTAGGTIGIDPETDMAGLCASIRLPLSDKSYFQKMVNQLAEAGRFWQRKIKEFIVDSTFEDELELNPEFSFRFTK